MRSVDIVVVEDNRGDVVLIEEAMAKVGISHRMKVLRDGVRAIEYLRSAGVSSDAAPLPKLIVLDLKLPRRSGPEILGDIQADPVLREIPLVIVSSSRSDLEEARKKTLPKQCCMVKPATFEGYVEMVRAMEAFRRAVGRRDVGGGDDHDN